MRRIRRRTRAVPSSSLSRSSGKMAKVQQLPTYGGDPVGAAIAINDQGQVVGISGPCAAFDPNLGLYMVDSHALLWQDGRVTDLGNLGGGGRPFGLDRRHHVSRLPLDHTLPGDFASLALGINDGGAVVGTSLSASFSPSRTFVAHLGRRA